MQHTPLQIKNILKEIAIEKGLSYDLVEEIYYHEFEFLRDAMEKGIKGEADTFNNILLDLCNKNIEELTQEEIIQASIAMTRRFILGIYKVNMENRQSAIVGIRNYPAYHSDFTIDCFGNYYGMQNSLTLFK